MLDHRLVMQVLQSFPASESLAIKAMMLRTSDVHENWKVWPFERISVHLHTHNHSFSYDYPNCEM